MRQKLFLLTLSILAGFPSSAQDRFKDKIFHSIGFTPIMDYMAAPATVYTRFAGTGIDEQVVDQYQGLSVFTFMYNFRYNLKEIYEEAALTISVTPALGVFIPYNGDATGYGSFNIPLMVGFETGAGASYNSTARDGEFIRIGVEWTIAPLVNTTDETSEAQLETAWLEPVVQAGFRYWNKKNKLRELSLKFGLGPSAPSEHYYQPDRKPTRAKTIRVSWIKFLDY